MSVVLWKISSSRARLSRSAASTRLRSLMSRTALTRAISPSHSIVFARTSTSMLVPSGRSARCS